MDILAPVSAGELLDKLSILRIKTARIADPDKLANIARERAALAELAAGALPRSPELDALEEALQEVNSELWEIEDAIRACEARQDFGAGFVELARAVYLTNDRRARIKRDINDLLGSTIVEEKSYARYGRE